LKYSVYIGATGGISVEVEAPEGTDAEQIYAMACDEASITDAECSDWDGSYEVTDEKGEIVGSGEPI
jgi:hypothetical protein